MPIAGSHRWRRFGTVAEQIAKVVYDRRRLLGIREEVAVAYQMELAELRAVYDERLAYLDAAACKAPHLVGAAQPALWASLVVAAGILVGLRFVVGHILRTRRQSRSGGWSTLRRERENSARQRAIRSTRRLYGHR